MNRFGPYDQNPLFAELYDYTPVYASRADVSFYVTAAGRANGKVLELGCGSGRILIPTAAAGHDCVGLDASRNMLARCREKLSAQPPEVQRRVRLVETSMTDFNLGESFALVTIPFRGFQHLLEVEEQVQCLLAIRRHLARDARLVFDVFHPNPQYLHDPAFHEEREETPETPLPGGRRFRRAWRLAAYRRAEQINEVEFIYYVTHADGRQERIVESFPFRYFFRFEMEHLLGRCGFRVAALYGDFDRSPLRNDSPEMIFVAEKD
ncbi:MAG: methyltransferase domain-containing protein [Acidobacteria bacterium]|nr:methyltransferase domain-containing protein [Acidobacteriota bacterium]